MFQIAAEHPMMFYKLIGAGLAAIYGVQVFLTIGGAMKMIPSTGVTLPFVSYGGSSVLSTFLIFGILQGIHIMRQKEVEEFERDRREEQEKNRAAARKRSETTVRNREKVARTKS